MVHIAFESFPSFAVLLQSNVQVSANVKHSEMHQIQHDEVRLCGADSDPHPFDTNSENELIRKVDWRLLPILGILYSIALIDRANV